MKFKKFKQLLETTNDIELIQALKWSLGKEIKNDEMQPLRREI